MTEVLDSAKYVSEKSELVTINEDAIEDFIQGATGRDFKPPAWDSRYHFVDFTEKTVAYFLVLDSLNFCFWPGEKQKRWEIGYGSEILSGYIGLAASLKMTVFKGSPITDAGFLSEITLNQLRRLLAGTNELQLMDKRREILNELGRVLLEDFQGRAVHLVEEAAGSAPKLASLLAEKLDSFRDTAWYKGREVLFLKRAQIFAADLYGAFRGKSWGLFRDMERLTAFADYKLPQVLRHLDILRYAGSLARKVDNRILLSQGSAEEVEIRAGTISAVERLRQEIEHRGPKLRAFEIDWLLWNMGQENIYRARPYHRTLTVFY